VFSIRLEKRQSETKKSPATPPRCQSPALTPQAVLFPVGAEQHYFFDQVRVFAPGRHETERSGSG